MPGTTGTDRVSERERIAVLESEVKALAEKIKNLVTKDEFATVKLITYGMAGIILSSVLISLLGRVLLSKP